MTRPKVSVITPTFNHEKYIEQCLESVKAQTYQDWEQIIVDDGSTDRTSAIVRENLDVHTHLRVVTHRGLDGLSRTYNDALEAAAGEFIAILEGDDTWPPDKLARQVPAHEKSGAILSWGNGTLIGPDGTKIGTAKSLPGRHGSRLIKACTVIPDLLLENFIVPSSGIVVRRESLQQVGGFQQVEGAAFIDLPTWLCLCAGSNPEAQLLHVNDQVVNYRVYPNQVSSNHRRMLCSTARISEVFVKGISPEEAGRLGLDLGMLGEIVSLQKARAAVACGDWAQARALLRSAWPSTGNPSKLITIETALSLTFRQDLAGLSLRIQRRLPGGGSPIGNLFRRLTSVSFEKVSTGIRPQSTIQRRIQEITRCPSCGGNSTAGDPIPEWGEWKICAQCTLQFADPRKLTSEPTLFFQNAYLGKEESFGLADFAARLGAREALRKAPHLWFWSPAFGEIFAWLKRRFGRNKTILDVGCGMGFVMLALKKEGFDVVGLDVAEEAVRVNAQDGLRVWHGTVETVPPDWVNPSAVLALFMLHHLEEPARFFATIKRKWPEASLIVAQYGPSNQDLQRSRPPRTLSLWNAHAIGTALNIAGYQSEIKEFRSTGAENVLFRKIQGEWNWRKAPSWLYRAAKRAEIALATSLLVPLQRNGFVIVAFGQPKGSQQSRRI